MAKYTIVLYYGTGFNLVNVPDSLGTLQAAAQSSMTITDNNITHIRGLTEFTIAATYTQICDADYCYVYNQTDSTDYAFFAITSDPTPNSNSVQTIHVAMDPLISCGGISAITFLGGITERYCVPLAEDTFGAFTEPDPYMTPSQPLKIVKGAIVGNGTSDMKTYYQSLIALDFLHLMAQAKQQITGYQLPGVSLYQGSGVGTLDNAIRSEIPHSAFSMRAGWKGRTSVVPTGEAYFMDELILSAPADTVTLSGGTAQALTALGTSRVYEAIQFAQSLGVENPVLNSWQVPGVYLDTTQMGGNYGEFETGALSYTDGNGTTYQTSGGRGGRLKGLIGINDKTNNSTLLFEYKTVKNKRVLVGEHNRYVLASTCSGNQAEYNPEDLYDFVNPTTAPYIWVIADPRPNGMPYARFKILHGDETEELFFLNAVPGMVWQRVPLIFYDKTGNALNQTQFKAETVVKDYNAEMDAIKHTGPFAGILSGNPISAAGAVAGSFTSGLSSMGGYLFGTNEQSFGNARAALNEVTDPSAQIRREREQQKSLELQKYQIGNAIVSPTIQFPRSESVRDLIGNGFVSYRYRYTDADAERIDQIMTAYGYKVTTMITANNQGAILNGRPRFNYVEIKGASVTTGRPKWMNDELSSALSTGLRIWHEKPDPTYYVNGNI